jgi:MYXO-CTERM domain-containing protein
MRSSRLLATLTLVGCSAAPELASPLAPEPTHDAAVAHPAFDMETVGGEQAHRAELPWVGAWSRVRAQGVELGHDAGVDVTLTFVGASIDGAKAGATARPPTQVCDAGDCRVEIDRGGLVEWWVALDQGVEQGFTVREAPAAGGPVVVSLSVGGATVSALGDGARLTGPRGDVWRVAPPTAVDAHGASLPTHLEVAEATLRVVVDASAAAFPVVIDPVYTTELTSVPNPGTATDFASVLTFGNFNTDTGSDLVVASPSSSSVAVYMNASNALPSTPTFTLTGTADASFGSALATGDFNCDRYDDLVVGEKDLNDVNGNPVGGAIHFFAGSASGLASTESWQVRKLSGSSYGHAVANVGDFDGDHCADFAVSVAGSRQVDLYVGSASGPTQPITLDVPYPYALRELVGADVNGDGLGDVVAGATPLGGGYATGALLVWFGTASGGLNQQVSQLVNGGSLYVQMRALASARDLNQDGYDDVAVGQGASLTATVFYGGPNGLDAQHTQTLNEEPNHFGNFGSALAGVGDVDGDGFPDLAVSSPNDAVPTTGGTGTVRIFPGSALGVVPGVGTKLLAPAGVTGFGAQLTGPGSLNGDYNVEFGLSVVGSAVHFFSGYTASDTDHDGFIDPYDCAPSNPAAHWGATEVYYNDVDEDCDGVASKDMDKDGYDYTPGVPGGDCDDTNPNVYPFRYDPPYDGMDADCSGGSDYDVDLDGFDSRAYGGDDCNDYDAYSHPGAPDNAYDGVDADCAGDSDYDKDHDGADSSYYGGSDCNDDDAAIGPGAPEGVNDQTDSDCDHQDDPVVTGFTLTTALDGNFTLTDAAHGYAVSFPPGTKIPSGTSVAARAVSGATVLTVSGADLPDGTTKSVTLTLPTRYVDEAVSSTLAGGTAVTTYARKAGLVVCVDDSTNLIVTPGASSTCPAAGLLSWTHRSATQVRTVGSVVLARREDLALRYGADVSATTGAAAPASALAGLASAAHQAFVASSGAIGASPSTTWTQTAGLTVTVSGLTHTSIVLYDDADDDGLPDLDEAVLGTLPDEADTDADGVSDGDEVAYGTSPTDAASVPDVDPDGDGLPSALETDLGTRSDLADSDGDGVTDGDEITDGTDPADGSASLFTDANNDQVDDRYQDTDGDGLTAAEEAALGTSPTEVDSDHDGVTDSDELIDGTNPADPASVHFTDRDNDGVDDRYDPCPLDLQDDADADGLCADVDNCPDLANADQVDADGDGAGAACDPHDAGVSDTDEDTDVDTDIADTDLADTDVTPADTDVPSADTDVPSADTDTGPSGGCGCAAPGDTGGSGWMLGLAGVAVARRRRARR